MDIFRSVSGMVEIQITSPDTTAAMERLVQAEIPVLSSKALDSIHITLVIPRAKLRRARSICQSRGDELTLRRRSGLYWTVKAAFSRPVLLLGLVLLLILELYVPGRVFFVRVEGNSTVPSRLILERAEECGIVFGATRREVRSERMKNYLLEALPQLQWAGINTYGCVAVISVRERSEEITAKPPAQVGSIVAARDGIVRTCTATAGNLLCAPGQAVREGEVLISGYTDCGLKIQATLAQGEVFAQTSRELEAVLPLSWTKKLEQKVFVKNFSLLVGKKRINFWKDSGICDTTCGRMYEEYYVTLPGGFVLPIGLAVDTYTCGKTVTVSREPGAWEETLSDFAGQYLSGQMIAGQILSRNQQFQADASLLKLSGSYICTEMIGRVKLEQIGELHGENS